MDKIIEFALVSWPAEMKIIILIGILIAFIVAPVAIFYLFKKHLGRERYIFKDYEKVLYMLDTVSGRVFYAQGTRGFAEVHVRNFADIKKPNKIAEKEVAKQV